MKVFENSKTYNEQNNKIQYDINALKYSIQIFLKVLQFRCLQRQHKLRRSHVQMEKKPTKGRDNVPLENALPRN